MNFSRSTEVPGFLDLVNVISRGGTSAWQDLYARAKEDVALRQAIREALPFVDPETGPGAQLWAELLATLEREVPARGQTLSDDGAHAAVQQRRPAR